MYQRMKKLTWAEQVEQHWSPGKQKQDSESAGATRKAAELDDTSTVGGTPSKRGSQTAQAKGAAEAYAVSKKATKCMNRLCRGCKKYMCYEPLKQLLPPIFAR